RVGALRGILGEPGCPSRFHPLALHPELSDGTALREERLRPLQGQDPYGALRVRPCVGQGKKQWLHLGQEVADDLLRARLRTGEGMERLAGLSDSAGKVSQVRWLRGGCVLALV